jgi:hypothetical protein
MKIIITKNKISTSLKNTLKIVSDFFKPVLDIEFTEEKIREKVFYSTYNFLDLDNTYKYFKAVDETWYDEKISKPYKAKGYDIVILILKTKDWDGRIYDVKGNLITGRKVGGFGNMENDWGIEEIALPYDTSGLFNFNGVQLEGNKLAWTIIHEILHRLYEMKGLIDNTHKYFLEANPYKCLEDFKEEIMPIALLKRTESNDKQTLGDLTISYKGKTFNCKVLEPAWKNNQKNISCIPKGLYKVKPHYSEKFGKVYWVQDVENRSYIYFHVGNYYKDTLGCLLVGDSYSDINKDGYLDVINSRKTLDKMLKFLENKEMLLSII